MKPLLFLISLLALVSCKDSKQHESNIKTNEIEHPTEEKHENHKKEASSVYENTWVKEIELDGGNKWNADITTNEGVQALKTSIKTQTTNTLNEYHALAKQLNDAKNNLIKNCTMKGSAHENLHTWLVPLIAKINALSETNTVEDAAKIKHSIEENINGYYTYFQ